MRTIPCTLALSCLLFITGCGDWPPPDRPPEPVEETPRPDPKVEKAERAIVCARTIVSDPSNWKANSIHLTELGELVQDLGMPDVDEFRRFDECAQSLIKFGTSWIDNLDEATISRLGVQLNRITRNTEASLSASIPLPVGEGIIQSPVTASGTSESTSEMEDVQAEAERLVFSTIRSLRAAQADEFGKLFADAQAAYRDLRVVLKSVGQTPEPVPSKAADVGDF